MVVARGEIEVGKYSDTGRVRTLNEDDCAAVVFPAHFPVLALLAVSDGMGGRNKGEIASQVAINAARLVVQELASRGAPATGEAMQLQDFGLAALSAANDAVLAEIDRHGGGAGAMGATLTLAIVSETHCGIGHIGDSRAYLWRASLLSQLTEDHAVGSTLTRRLGKAADIEPQVAVIPVAAGDALLLCSDGIVRMVSDAELAACLEGAESANDACIAAVRLANLHGGVDNASVAVAALGRRQRNPAAAQWLADALGAQEAGAASAPGLTDPIAVGGRALLGPGVMPPETMPGAAGGMAPAAAMGRPKAAVLVGLAFVVLLAGVLAGLAVQLQSTPAQLPEAVPSGLWPPRAVAPTGLARYPLPTQAPRKLAFSPVRTAAPPPRTATPAVTPTAVRTPAPPVARNLGTEHAARPQQGAPEAHRKDRPRAAPLAPPVGEGKEGSTVSPAPPPPTPSAGHRPAAGPSTGTTSRRQCAGGVELSACRPAAREPFALRITSCVPPPGARLAVWPGTVGAACGERPLTSDPHYLTQAPDPELDLFHSSKPAPASPDLCLELENREDGHFLAASSQPWIDGCQNDAPASAAAPSAVEPSATAPSARENKDDDHAR
ncbi:MAG: protein phosphatase 2C domain-containing protein [Candidatus Schekmanbacteria bacterium]|nr:protein phosphatase 2C domain-containing protein [Candidatus Schekmanbacteria bacterium]